MQTCAAVLDLLVSGRIPAAADVIAQRLRALGVAETDGRHLARRVEVLAPPVVSPVLSSLRAPAIRQFWAVSRAAATYRPPSYPSNARFPSHPASHAPASPFPIPVQLPSGVRGPCAQEMQASRWQPRGKGKGKKGKNNGQFY